MPKTSSRVLALLSLLQSPRDWPGHVLADRLGVSARTVRRDVERLRELGYRVRSAKGPDGGYRLEAGSEVPPLLFDDDQVVAISIALQAAALSSAGIDEAAGSALRSIRQVLPDRLRPRLDVLHFTAAAEAGAVADPGALSAVSAAIRAHEELRFDYVPVGAETGERRDAAPRRIQPHHLVAMQGRWYLIGWSEERGDWRVYRVDRMTLRTHRGKAFVPRTVPGGDPHAFLRARFRGAGLSGDWPCRGRALLRAPAARIAPFVTDGVVEAVTGETCIVGIGAWSWGALAARLAQFEVEIGVVAPAELREAFQELAARASRVSRAAS